ncbi:MAG: glutamate-5-semialdehyde dehydrogenase [Nitrospirae bacterium CG_4_10_14_3_um_filter_44_29]|nr:glutamate-5-semialdehyde dehydrogenase [Nitrospirota bacterium]OIO30354.1 MAG: glutamate-5-semialdehyde dehydrogenase [Nitrospirae bacterium CG1_02_44_142]PIV40404.1 MAG: glutamate-5-semialdehyde dehydrogenase [Nitrospirae bacterium CG02_land_8_20_14_3_00_44_33]PIV67240.1 MAG: glutamate-5-semialdehyde dehydrogenase [Nitrospirae bacterium CG01_land_8_20_14_3_00_44_22]PIW90436.1 MAG: glutamate-5-semialdehyde dehydrogenase [Nitrospirae bacterium CG_4_8_14_3_um_filter_44_28]PIX87392.1 MAG: glut
MDIKAYVLKKAKAAKEGARLLAKASSKEKNNALLKMAAALKKRKAELIKENKKDIAFAEKKGLSKAMIDRLALNDERINEMAQGLIEVAALPDPVGEVIRMWERPNGMVVGKMRVPIGVIGIIYESRPNVTADASSLCLKAGNAVILRGGSEAINSNKAIVKILRDAAKTAGLDEDAITFIDIPEREAVMEMLKLEGIIDLIIPRGGEGLIRTVTANSRIPVLKHYKGVCHIFVDRAADLKMAEDICFNAKVQRPGTCNAMETMLVDKKVAKAFLPSMIKRFKAAKVSLKGCPETRKIDKSIAAVREDDFYMEYLDLILNVKVVKDMDEAIEHIAKYSSAHSDAIVTENYEKAMRFLREVDSSAVFVNASTRLNDGYQFGLGAEIGISTDKIHARGPMGLEELTCTKFIVLGDGQIRE